jgi:methionine-S-sulfoxide reductase
MGGACAAPPSPRKADSKLSSSGDQAVSPQDQTAVATFAAGCFWGVEDKFRKLKGVISTRVGYSGGNVKNPTYRQVCSDKTGHAESIEIVYDPAAVSYDALLQRFFRFHDPTQVNRQGPDVGTQYRSVIFYHDESQKDAALKMIQDLNASGQFKRPIATQVVPAAEFYQAEDYHQQYYEKFRRGK